jgi:outer membrane protein OmpA-like peptidoglycan-associated protein
MKISKLVVSAVAASVTMLAVTGCHTTDAYTGERKVSKTTKGAGIGALTGAILGAVTGDNSKERRKRALAGAGIGALAGGAVGNYMDRQEARLRAQLQGSGVSVTRNGNDITLNMPGNITFQTASADLNGNFFRVLDSVALVLKEFNQTLVDVEGHTDSVGADDYNLDLSQRRAGTVAGYLRNRGVTDQRIVAVGAGEAKPVADNGTAEGRQQNRRVELRLQPITAS